MQRVATVYVGTGAELTEGVRALLTANAVDIVSIDVGSNMAARSRVLQEADAHDLPVIELDGRFSGGKDIVRLSRTLGLKLMQCGPKPPGACC